MERPCARAPENVVGEGEGELHTQMVAGEVRDMGTSSDCSEGGVRDEPAVQACSSGPMSIAGGLGKLLHMGVEVPPAVHEAVEILYGLESVSKPLESVCSGRVQLVCSVRDAVKVSS